LKAADVGSMAERASRGAPLHPALKPLVKALKRPGDGAPAGWQILAMHARGGNSTWADTLEAKPHGTNLPPRTVVCQAFNCSRRPDILFNNHEPSTKCDLAILEALKAWNVDDLDSLRRIFDATLEPQPKPAPKVSPPRASPPPARNDFANGKLHIEMPALSVEPLAESASPEPEQGLAPPIQAQIPVANGAQLEKSRRRVNQQAASSASASASSAAPHHSAPDAGGAAGKHSERGGGVMEQMMATREARNTKTSGDAAPAIEQEDVVIDIEDDVAGTEGEPPADSGMDDNDEAGGFIHPPPPPTVLRRLTGKPNLDAAEDAEEEEMRKAKRSRKGSLN